MRNRDGSTPARRRAARTATLVALALPLVAAGCGNLTVGGLGEVEVAVSGDAPGGAPQGASRSGPAPAPSAVLRSEQPEGELRVEFDLFLVSEGGAVTPLNDDRLRVRLDLRGRSEVDVVNRRVEATRYTELRIVFTDVRAEVESGLLINGIPVLGEVRVEMRNARIEVARPLDLRVGVDQRVALLVDMNAAAWLAAVDPLTRLVDPTVFASRLAVVVR